MKPLCCPALIVTLLIGCASLACGLPDLVVPLNADDFEHDTQASTGQTTGHWAVLFTTSQDSAQQPWLDLWDELAQSEDKNKIFAQVDGSSNPALVKRFSIQQLPAVLLFKDRKMYRYPGMGDLDREDLVAFLDAGHIKQGGETVPPPASSWQEQLNKYIPKDLEKFIPKDPLHRYATYVAAGFIPVLLLAVLLLPKDPHAAAAIAQAQRLQQRRAHQE